MNRRILKKRCKIAVEALIRDYGYKAADFLPARGEETIYAPQGMSGRAVSRGYLDPGPLPGTPLHWSRTSWDCDDWDCSLPTDVLASTIHWTYFRPSAEDLA